MRQHVGWDPLTGVLHFETDPVPRPHAWVWGLLAGRQLVTGHTNSQVAAFGHGIPGIHRQVHDHLLQAGTAGPYPDGRRWRFHLQGD